MGRDRIVFFSKEDMSWNYNLKKTEALFAKTTATPPVEINDFLELYQVKQYFGEGVFLNEWDEPTKAKYIAMAEESMNFSRKHFTNIDDNQFLIDLDNLDFNYRKSYWHLLQYFQAYNKLTSQSFKTAVEKHQHHLHYILENKKVIAQFDLELRELIISDHENAEILLSATEQKKRRDYTEIFFPPSMTVLDKENLIVNYLNGNDPNLNFVNLVQNVKDSPQLKLSPKTRLLAKNKAAAIKDEIFKNNSGAGIGITIHYVREQVEPLKVKSQNLETDLYYGVKFLDNLEHNVQLFHCFRSLFGFIDEQNMIEITSKESELSVMERIGMNSKNSYPNGFRFQYKTMQSQAQIMSFQAYLEARNTKIETVISGFIAEYLNPVLGLEKLVVTLPDAKLDSLSKIRILAPELENILRQYHLFVSEGHIDHDLLQINSEPLFFSNISSLLKPKYYYATGDEIKTMQHHFFSDQSMLFYVEKYEGKYLCFFDLITEEQVTFSEFKSYQQDMITWMIEKKYLHIGEGEVVIVTDPNEIDLAGILFRDGALNYWRHDQTGREAMMKMKEKGWLTEGHTLLSKQEVDYFNFYLNKKTFSNGFDIRNKYLHGTNNQTEKAHEIDYYSLLKLTVLALLKIEDELLTVRSKTKTDG